MRVAKMRNRQQSQYMTSTFYGYKHKHRIYANEFYDTKNLTSDGHPLLSTRPLRGTVMELEKPAGLIAKDALAVVDGTAVIYNGYRIEMGLSDVRPKQLVSMGAYMVIFPDKKYINTADIEDYGELEARWEAGTFPITYTPCSATGEPYENAVIQPTEPESPVNGAYWVDTSTKPHVLLQYSAGGAMWSQIPEVYTKISATGIGEQFMEYDGVTISGCSYQGDSSIAEQIQALNAPKVIYAKDSDWIVVVGMLDQQSEQEGGVKVARTVPDMDYVCEAGNRLWGCKYGLVNGEPVNEIYGSKLGDFKNWNCFLGISTDSWAASVGSDGQFTAAVNYLGCPTFFKEEVIHRVSISAVGAHQIQDTICSGVQKGSWLSPAVAGELLFYKGRSGIYAYDGSQPVEVSDAFGNERYTNAVGGAIGSKYYVSMEDIRGTAHFFVYDTAKGIWMREDNTRAMMFAAADGDLFYIDAQTDKIMSVMGTQGEKETQLEWEAVSGVQHYEEAGKKYLSRYSFRVRLQPGSVFRLFLQYDSDGTWHSKGDIRGDRLNTYTLPVVPRRCDHLQYRMEGSGPFELFSLTRIFEEGSDR